MGNYFGTYSRSLDAKGRLQLPSKLGEIKNGRLYILKGFEGCLSVYDEESFEILKSKLTSLNFFDEESRKFIRLASASVQCLELDSHGRVLLSKQTLDDNRIGSDVTIIGVFDHFEIWDPTQYAAFLLQNAGNYEALAGKVH